MTQDYDKVISAYSTSEHLLLDLDNINYDESKWLIRELQEEFIDVSHCLMVRTKEAVTLRVTHPDKKWLVLSEPLRESYHLVFDGKLEYNRIMEIIELMASLDLIGHLYVHIRQWRGDVSLRVSHKLTIQRKASTPQPIQLILSPYKHIGEHMINRYLAALMTYNPDAFLFIQTPIDQALRQSLNLPHHNPYREVFPDIRLRLFHLHPIIS